MTFLWHRVWAAHLTGVTKCLNLRRKNIFNGFNYFLSSNKQKQIKDLASQPVINATLGCWSKISVAPYHHLSSSVLKAAFFPFICWILFFFFSSLYRYKNRPVMSDSPLSPLFGKQRLEKDQRKEREEKRPFCYFQSWDLLHRLFRQVDELLQKVY